MDALVASLFHRTSVAIAAVSGSASTRADSVFYVDQDVEDDIELELRPELRFRADLDSAAITAAASSSSSSYDPDSADGTPAAATGADDCSQFTFVVYVGVFGATCAFGLVGNLLSWAVLGWEQRRRTGRVATFLLRTMAVVDNLFLLTVGVAQISMALKLYLIPVPVPVDAPPNVTSLPIMRLLAANGSASTSFAPAHLARANFTTAGSSALWVSPDCATGVGPVGGVVGRIGGVSRSPIDDLIGYVEDDGGGVGCDYAPPTTDGPVAAGSETGSLFAFFIVHVSAYAAVVVFPLVHVTQMWTVWITVLVAVNRYVAICRPFQASQLCTMKQTMRQIVALGVAIFVYCLPRFFEYQIVYEEDPYFGGRVVPVENETDIKSNFVYNVVYENLLYCLFIFLGPLLIITVTHACLVRELIGARRRRRSQHMPLFAPPATGNNNWFSGTSGGGGGGITANGGSDNGEQNLTLVMVVIVLIFVVCQTPAFVNQILFSLIGREQYECGKVYYYYFHVSNVVVSANSSLNFVVYCVFRRQFRHRLRACCRGERSSRGLLYRSAVYGARRGGGGVTLTGGSSPGIGDAMHFPLRVVVPTANWAARSSASEQ